MIKEILLITLLISTCFVASGCGEKTEPAIELKPTMYLDINDSKLIENEYWVKFNGCNESNTSRFIFDYGNNVTVNLTMKQFCDVMTSGVLNENKI